MLDPRGGPISGAPNWSSGFMPAAYQGTRVPLDGRADPESRIRRRATTPRHAARPDRLTATRSTPSITRTRPGYSEIAARIASYELAFQPASHRARGARPVAGDRRPSRAVWPQRPEARLASARARPGAVRPAMPHRAAAGRTRRALRADLSRRRRTSSKTGTPTTASRRTCSIHCPEIDKPIAALLTDLEQRGLLDETLVVWGGEFGTPARRSARRQTGGRDHNPQGLHLLAGRRAA